MRVPAMIAAMGVASCGTAGTMVDVMTTTLPETMPHDQVKFAARYGEVSYLIDARYVDTIDQSVIVVRQDRPSPAERTEVSLEARIGAGDEPFASSRYGVVAVDIAEQLVERAEICPGDRMQIGRTIKGEARRMYRSNEQAWVVFAFCPAPVKAEG